MSTGLMSPLLPDDPAVCGLCVAHQTNTSFLILSGGGGGGGAGWRCGGCPFKTQAIIQKHIHICVF